ncbi:MAG: hypothetical protein IPG71_06000 [bacterium]|nr:hypothetical protein [bacterium]
MNSSLFLRAALAAFLIVALCFWSGCDDRNDADLPSVVYSLKHTIVTPGSALDCDAGANLVAIAASSAGTYVYDISNPASPVEEFHYEQLVPFYSTLVALDTVNHLVASASSPSAPGDRYPIHYYVGTDRRLTFATFSGPFDEMAFTSRLDTFTLWGTDGDDGLVAGNYCHDGDSTWTRDCPTFWQGWDVDQVRMRGFDIKNQYIAIALADYRIHIRDTELNSNVSIFLTPGDPQDCEWYGDYLMVADNLYFTIFNAANIDSPVVVTTMTIPGADRLIRVKMDEHRALLLDDADGIYVVDVSDVTNPRLLQSIPLPEPTGIAAANGRLIATDQQLGTLIYER